jgi:molecular chaperone GrpE
MFDSPKPDPVEPAGEQDPAVEQEYDEARESSSQTAEASSPSAESSSQDVDSSQSAEEAAEPASDPIAAAEEEARRYLDLAQRTQAEFENYRKRAARDQAQAGERAKANLIRELLPVLDNLERALATANPEEDHLAEGVRLVHAELVNTLERHGIESFDPAGEPFDPTYHEALSTRPADNGQAGVVLDVIEKGYKSGDVVLRPARVVVAG